MNGTFAHRTMKRYIHEMQIHAISNRDNAAVIHARIANYFS